MVIKGVPLFSIWFAVRFVWKCLAPKLSPYLRNITGIIIAFVALCMFLLVLKEWFLVVSIWGVIVWAMISKELHPWDEEEHAYWRGKVTFLQDFLVMAGSLLIMLEAMILLG